jgi:hypothetical protein
MPSLSVWGLGTEDTDVRQRARPPVATTSADVVEAGDVAVIQAWVTGNRTATAAAAAISWTSSGVSCPKRRRRSAVIDWRKKRQ